MRFTLERVSDPEIEPVTNAEFARNVGEFDDTATARADDITRLITSAREWAEDLTGRALIDQTWRLTLTDELMSSQDTVTTPGYYAGTWKASAGEILLRRSPALSIVSFKTVDADGDETDVDAATYELREADSKFPKIVALSGGIWDTGTYRIVFRAGYANRDVSPQEGASVVPARFRQAILLHAEAYYDRGKDMEKLLATAEGLILPERCNLDLA